jgi:hypothetical protein
MLRRPSPEPKATRSFSILEPRKGLLDQSVVSADIELGIEINENAGGYVCLPVIPTLLSIYGNSAWQIGNLPVLSKVSLFNAPGQLVYRSENYAHELTARQLAAGSKHAERKTGSDQVKQIGGGQ